METSHHSIEGCLHLRCWLGGKVGSSWSPIKRSNVLLKREKPCDIVWVVGMSVALQQAHKCNIEALKWDEGMASG